MDFKLIIRNIIIVLIIILIIILLGKLINYSIITYNAPLPVDTPVDYTSNLEKLDVTDILINLNDCIKNYNINLASHYDKYKVFDMLDDEYIKFKGITKDNITDKIAFKFNYFNPREAYTRQVDANKWYIYFYGVLISRKENKVNDYGYIVKLDRIKNCFTILPYDYMLYKNYNNLEDVKKDELLDFNINKNLNNEYKINYNNTEDIAEFYYNILKNEYIYDKNYAYSKVNKEYIDKNNFTFEKFKNSINLTKETRFLSSLHKILENDNKISEYKCKDSNNNIISFKVKEGLDYYIEFE